MEKLPKFLQSDVFKRLEEVTDLSTLSKEERRSYDVALMHYRDSLSVLEHNGQIREEKGRREGREEEKLEMARIMKESHYDLKEIARITKLPLEEVEKL